MSGESTTSSRDQHSSGPARVAVLDQALWQRLAEGESLQETLQSWLAIQCGLLAEAESAVLVLRPENSDSPFAPVAHWPEDSKPGPGLVAAAELVIAQGSGIIHRDEQAGVNQAPAIAYPLRIGEDLLGAISVQLHSASPSELKQAMRQLQLGSGWFEALTRREKARQQLGDERGETLALELIDEALEDRNFQAASISVANELAVALRCERVSLGFLHRGSVRVATLSHTAQLDSRLDLLNAIAEAMDEALDQQTAVLEPDSSGEAKVTRAHRKIVEQLHTGQVLTVPFNWQGEQVGAITYEKSRGDSFSSSELALCKTVTGHVGSVLEERRRESRWFGAKLTEKVTLYLEQLFGPGYLAVKCMSAAFVVVSLFLLLVSGEFRVAAIAQLKGEEQRVIAAPFDGYVAEANYRAGDRVKAGEVIAYLDDRELILERARWDTERRQYLLEYDQALGDQRRSEIAVIRARISQAEAQVELLDAQLQRTRLVAPFDGMLVSGDLSQSIGGAVRKGDKLFELVPQDRYRVVIQVDETDIRHIAGGQAGSLVLSAVPGADLQLEVTKVGAVSVSDQGANTFEVEARLRGGDELALRPGMEGIAKIEAGDRRLAWIWTHRFFDWLRLQLWSAWP